MSFDKSIGQAPIGGIGTPNTKIKEEAPLGIDTGLFDANHPVMGGDDQDESSDIVIIDDTEIDGPLGEEADDFYANLAENFDEDELKEIASDLLEEFSNDEVSRSEWLSIYADGLELLGLKNEERTAPWVGACGVYHPLLSEALVKFQAETMMETFPPSGPVKTQIVGKDSHEKREAAQRVQEDMNLYLTEKMSEYRDEHERMLWGLGLSGNAFKKVYYDTNLERPVSLYVPAEDLVVPYGASNLQSSERITHIMRKTSNELRKMQVSGFYLDVDVGDPVHDTNEVEKKIAEKQGFDNVNDGRHRILEIHTYYDLKGFEDKDEKGHKTGIALPYVITIDKGTQQILSIRRNWLEDDETKQKREFFVHYSYVPAFGFYAFGLIHLIGAFAKAGTSLIRQLVDAGTLSNLSGGFKTKGMRVLNDGDPISPGEFRDVDIASGVLRDNIMTLPYKEPSQTLISLLQGIIDDGRRFASAADIKISDMSGQAPVGTTLAILERTLKIMSAVQARIHASMKQEFKLIKGVISDYMPSSYAYEPSDDTPAIKAEDYATTNVIPVSDPNAATMAQKILQYQAVLQLAGTAPQLYDLPYLHQQMLDVMGIQNVDKIIPQKDKDTLQPIDPVSENMNIITGKPVKAFIGQDHEAHIAVHTAAMQDPQIAQLVGQSPQAQQMMAAAAAHIQEHVAFAYRKQIEDAAGVPYPPPNAKMDPNMEVQISRLAAEAAKNVIAGKQSADAQQKAMQAQQDPVVIMQQQELQLKQQELQLKQYKVQLDAAAKADEHVLEREKIASQERISGLTVAARVATDNAMMESQNKIEGVKIAQSIAKQAADFAASEDYSKSQNQLQQPRGNSLNDLIAEGNNESNQGNPGTSSTS